MRVSYAIVFVGDMNRSVAFYLGAFHARMVERGVRCVQEPKDVFGARLAQDLDPDGLAFSIGEPRRVRGEGLAGASSAGT